MCWLIVSSLFLVYCLIPSYWARNCSNRILRKGSGDRMVIALTFDDGPHPEYTPRLLAILKKYGVRATFFIVGEQADLYPSIVKRIAKEGHAIGCHSYSHNHAWFMPPIATIKDMNRSYNSLFCILKRPPNWYRPPWGTFNLFSLFAANRLDLDMAYWSIEARDWARDTTARDIYCKVVGEAKSGSVIVLHDNRGAKGAPERTLDALPNIIETLHQEGFSFITLDEMGGTYSD